MAKSAIAGRKRSATVDDFCQCVSPGQAAAAISELALKSGETMPPLEVRIYIGPFGVRPRDLHKHLGDAEAGRQIDHAIATLCALRDAR